MVQVHLQSQDEPLFFGLVSRRVNTSGSRIGRVKYGVYWCIYACIGRMSMCSGSSTHGVHNGVITVPMYQGNNILCRLNTCMLYVLIKITTLTRVFCAVKLTDKVRLVDTYHG